MTEEKATKTEEKKAPEKAPEKPKVEEDVVLIGRKPVMNYVTACLTFFNSGSKKVVLKARGRAISRAVDTVELTRRAFLKDLELKSINIGTERLTREDGRESNVSTMEITVVKP
ncbi:MAG: DNA-binding protein Alba [Thermoproteota archaeon]|nr:DNA-binding protein Alba [Thermoproteota archaeon]